MRFVCCLFCFDVFGVFLACLLVLGLVDDVDGFLAPFDVVVGF